MPPVPSPEEQQTLSRRALDALPLGLVITDPRQPDNPIVHVSGGFEALTGYGPDEALGRNCRFLQGADTDPTARAQIRQALQDGQGCRVCLRNVRKDGTTFWNELTLAPVRDEHGALTHWAGTLSDVSTRQEEARAHERLKGAYARERRIAETLQESALQITDILESITDGFFAVDKRWRFTYLNREAETLLGRTRADLLGARLWESFPEGGPFHAPLTRAAEQNTSVTFTEFFAPRSEWFEVHAYPTPEGLAIYVRDATERQELLTRQRAFVRDVLASVTGGKLRLCAAPLDLPPPGTSFGGPVTLSRTEGLGELRHRADDAAKHAGLPDDRRADLVLAVGEAAMNAVTHAGVGAGTVSLTDNGTVQIRVEDHGSGIQVENLPRATLERGYTTTGTMGQGMKMMLQIVDRLWLLTGAEGTTVVLEQDREAPASPANVGAV